MTSEAFVFRLPAEIFIEVVEIAILVPPKAIRYVAFDSDYKRDSVLLLRLSHVCQLWRALITETRFLWSFASTLFGPELTQHVIELSRESLLAVDLDLVTGSWRKNSVFATKLYEQQTRIKSLKISLYHNNKDPKTIVRPFLEAPAPSLQAVSIICLGLPGAHSGFREFCVTMPLFSDDHPRLRSVHLSNIALPWNSSVFSGLTRLVVQQVPASKGPKSEQLLSILNNCLGLVDLELSNAGPVDEIPVRRERITLCRLLSLALYMPQATCRDFLSLLDLPKLVRLSIGHDEKCDQDIRRLVPSRMRPPQASQSVEVTIHPSLNYSRIVFRSGTSDQHPESFRFHYYYKSGDDFDAKCNFVTSALVAWDENHAMPMTLRVTLDPFRSGDVPLAALGRVLSLFSNIVSIVFTTIARSGYEDDVYDALYILEETVKHGQLTAPLLAELTFQRMRFAGRFDALRHILQFRSTNGAVLPHLTFKTCTGIQESQLGQMCDEKIICDFSLI